MGVRNVTISDNTIYNWRAPIYFNRNCTTVRVLNNAVQDPQASTLALVRTYTFNSAEVAFSGNTYFSSASTARWFSLDASIVSVSQWQLTAEDDMVAAELTFQAPARSTA